MVYAMDLNDSVIKRLWCILKSIHSQTVNPNKMAPNESVLFAILFLSLTGTLLCNNEEV